MFVIYLLIGFILMGVVLSESQVSGIQFPSNKLGISCHLQEKVRLKQRLVGKVVHSEHPGLHDVIASAASVDSKTNANKTVSKRRDITAILAAAFCAAAIMYPLDLIRALQMANAGSSLTTSQLLVNFKNAHGFQGFFTQGLVPELLRSTWMRFIKFSLFPMVHLAVFQGVSVEKGSSFSKSVAAFIGSVPEVISIMPLEIAKISLQLDTKNLYKNNMFKAMAAVAKERGLPGFLIGYVGVNCRQALWSAGYFSSIDFFDKKMDQCIRLISGGKLNAKSNKSTQVFSQLVSGFLAGVFGGVLNTPFDTVRSTVQKRILTNAVNVETTFLGVWKEILASKGASGLYTGFSFKAMHLGGGGALMAFFIPFFKKLLENVEF